MSHEPDFHTDVGVMPSAHNDKNVSFDYINNYRKYSIYKRIKKCSDIEACGEATGTLRYHFPRLKKVFPGANLLAVLRNGRDVVRSVYGFKQFYSKDTRGTYSLMPGKNDPYLSKRDKLSRFEKVCWSWEDLIEKILKDVPLDSIAYFEQIAKDYDYFESKILKPLVLDDVNELIQYKYVRKKSENSTKKNVFPYWQDWPSDYINKYNGICGEALLKISYYK